MRTFKLTPPPFLRAFLPPKSAFFVVEKSGATAKLNVFPQDEASHFWRCSTYNSPFLVGGGWWSVRGEWCEAKKK